MAMIPAGRLQIALDREGKIAGLLDAERKRECLPAGRAAPLLTVVVGKETLAPASATYDEGRGRIDLVYGQGEATAEVRVKVRPTHATFEVASIEGKDRVDSVVWGPYPTTIGETIGEIVGVVRNDEFAIGIQALSRHTLAGYPGQPEGLGVGGRDHAATAAERESARSWQSLEWRDPKRKIPQPDRLKALVGDGTKCGPWKCRSIQARLKELAHGALGPRNQNMSFSLSRYASNATRPVGVSRSSVWGTLPRYPFSIST